MYKITDYFTKKIIAENIETHDEANRLRDELRKDKLDPNKNAKHNWLLVVTHYEN